MFPGLTVAVGNDAQIAMLAEAVEGGQSPDRCCCRDQHGHRLGHYWLAGASSPGTRGGLFFSWACADAMMPAKTAAAGPFRFQPALWMRRTGPGTGNGTALIAAARADDGAAAAALEAPMRSLGTLASAVALLNPQTI